MTAPRSAFFALLLITFLLSGCRFDGFDAFRCYEAVVKSFPGSEVHSCPNSSYKWLVRKPDGSVWIAATMGMDAVVTSSEQIFSPIPCKEASK